MKKFTSQPMAKMVSKVAGTGMPTIKIAISLKENFMTETFTDSDSCHL